MALPKTNKPTLRNQRFEFLTDDQILSRKFDIADPETLPNLMAAIPNGIKIKEIEYQYHTPGGRAAYVYCAHCKEHTHNKGFVLLYVNEMRALVGNMCGKKHYGIEFNAIENEFRALQQRAQWLKRRNKLIDQEQQFLSEMDNLLKHPAIPMFEDLRREFNRVFSGLTRKLQESAIRQNGQLSIEEKVRDFDAEIRREEKIDLQKERAAKLSKSQRKQLVYQGQNQSSKERLRPIFKNILKPIGRVSGLDIILPKDQPSSILETLNNRTRIFYTQLKEETQTSKLGLLIRAFEKIVEDVSTEVFRLQTPTQFFEKRNLELLVTWANSQLSEDQKISFDNQKLARYDYLTDTTFKCELLLNYVPPSDAFLKDVISV
jgi:hypothetical protein